MDKEYVRKVSSKAKEAIYDLIRMRRPYQYLVQLYKDGTATINLHGMSLDEFKDKTVEKCREVTDLIWDLWKKIKITKMQWII